MATINPKPAIHHRISQIPKPVAFTCKQQASISTATAGIDEPRPRRTQFLDAVAVTAVPLHSSHVAGDPICLAPTPLQAARRKRNKR
ncbi:hypothetical protein M0R45_019694 [Rubus argutus]|uniref:Uncharacterized protein n=1 Tax=Rubus argutus TaxID=59490 RepID=A0AAW1X8K0_RUBAR